MHQRRVALYFFNLFNDDVTLGDEGLDFANAEEAVAHATLEVRAMAAETVMNGHFVRSHYIEVQDELRQRVGKVRFDEAVEIRP